MKKSKHLIQKVIDDSIACELEIEPGDYLISINQEPLEDVFDYQFMIQEEYLEVLIEKSNGEEWLLEIEKDEEEDLGIVFENGLMDEYRSCHNKCIFCFIDQMPKGMRETLYFKDDDARLSFLQGNYITLTNLSEQDIQRIIKYNLSPVNISFQTMNKELRCKMLNNRFAGEALTKAEILRDAGIHMNGQIVLCKGVNDREELDYSLEKLSEYLPNLESVSIVPVGLSKYRDGLFPLEPFTKEDAIYLIEQVQRLQDKIYPIYGLHFIHASDEWYILAEKDFPEAATYDGYLQYENGVGMMRHLLDDYYEELPKIAKRYKHAEKGIELAEKRVISLVTGLLAKPYIESMANDLMKQIPGVQVQVFGIRNNFFGEQITVAGLLTGQDIIKQLEGIQLGEKLLLPQAVLRAEEDVFLDDLTKQEVESALQVKIDIVKSSGRDFLEKILGF